MNLRLAELADTASIESLIDQSVRELCARDYTPAQIEGALQGAFGLDTQLIRDASYFVIEDGEKVVAAGGWSYRQTLFGSDSASVRDPKRINPATGAAKVRAFFVDPARARCGLGSELLRACEQAARAAGFKRLELMATLAGQRLYKQHGFIGGSAIQHDLGEGLTIEFVPMTKTLDNA